MLYFCRLNMGNINPLLKEAYELNKNLDGEGLYTWYNFVKNIFEDMEFDTKDFKSADFVKYAKMKLMMVIVLLFRKNI